MLFYCVCVFLVHSMTCLTLQSVYDMVVHGTGHGSVHTHTHLFFHSGFFQNECMTWIFIYFHVYTQANAHTSAPSVHEARGQLTKLVPSCHHCGSWGLTLNPCSCQAVCQSYWRFSCVCWFTAQLIFVGEDFQGVILCMSVGRWCISMRDRSPHRGAEEVFSYSSP